MRTHHRQALLTGVAASALTAVFCAITQCSKLLETSHAQTRQYQKEPYLVQPPAPSPFSRTPPPLQFNDTPKPNAAVLLPVYYHGDRAFNNIHTQTILDSINVHYDLHVSVVKDKYAACDILKSIKDLELVVLTGHGSPTTVDMGSSPLATTDAQFSECLQTLKPSATIFAYSCRNGNGRERANNLANFLRQNSPSSYVIAMERDFYAHELQVSSYYPFRIAIPGVTYEGPDSNSNTALIAKNNPTPVNPPVPPQGNTHGTTQVFVNGQPIHIQNGQKVRIGNVQIESHGNTITIY